MMGGNDVDQRIGRALILCHEHSPARAWHEQWSKMVTG